MTIRPVRGRAQLVRAALALVILAACSSAPAARPVLTAADAGFRPGQHGFAFENYGDALSDGSSPTNLTAEDVRAMFGDDVCADAAAGRCDLIPEARAWQDATNREMGAGHCYGFSVAAELLWQGMVDPKVLGASEAPDLDIARNHRLQRLIAYDWALQLLDSVQDKRVTGTPNEILKKLGEVLVPKPPETYTVTFFKPDFTAGHAVTPFAVQDKGGGIYDVLIYDNNWPNQTRAITFDTTADTWTYDAAINPNRPEEIYVGDAKTKSIMLLPTSPGLGPQPCPFCDKRRTASSRVSNVAVKPMKEEIFLLSGLKNHADVTITDDDGHRLGYVDGKVVQEIPGARLDPLVANQDWLESASPIFFVPADRRYTITIDGARLGQDDTETLGVIGPSFDVSVDDIVVKPGERDVLTLEPLATRLTYTSSRVESPTIEVAVSDNRAEYSFKVAGLADQPGSTLSLSLPPDGGTLTVRDAGTQTTSTVNLEMTRYTTQGVHVFRHEAVPLAGEDTARLRYGDWTDDDQGIELETTHDGRTVSRILANRGTG